MTHRALALLAGLALSLAAAGGAAAQDFVLGDWKGYRAEEDADRGCRMAKRVAPSLSLIVYANAAGEVGIGAVRGAWSLPTGAFYEGFLRLDGGQAARLDGRAENPQMIMLYPGGAPDALAADLARSGRIELAVADAAIDTALDDVGAALDELYACAEAQAGLDAPTVAVSEPSRAIAVPADWGRFAVLGLSVDYPGYLVEDARELISADGTPYGATFLFELGRSYMHAWVADHAGSPYSYVIAAGGAERTVTYRVDKPGLGVWSGYEGEDIFYDMCKRAPGERDRLHCFRLYYPERYRDVFDPVVERAARTLR